MPPTDGDARPPRRPTRTRPRSLAVALLSTVPLLAYALALRGAGAVAEADPRPPPGPGGVACTLPLGRQMAAARAFREMTPVFRHPRCLNCHGGLDITSDDHAGAEMARETGLDPRGFLSPDERRRLHAECGTCHDNIRGTAARMDGSVLSGWMVPPQPMLWTGKSDEELCMLIKTFESDGRHFVDHIEHDHDEIQFIEAAFNGDRALGAEGLRDNDLTAAPPPGSQASLTASARRWVDAMGAEDGWTGDAACGCRMPALELTAHLDVVIDADMQMRVRMSATVPLTADSTGLVFHGEAPLVPGDFSLTPPPGCSASHTFENGTFVVRDTRLDATDDGGLTVDLRHRMTPAGGSMTITCPRTPPIVLPMTLLSEQWVAVNSLDRTTADYRVTDFETPGGSSADGRTLVARKVVPRRFDTGRGTVTTTSLFEIWALPGATE